MGISSRSRCFWSTNKYYRKLFPILTHVDRIYNYISRVVKDESIGACVYENNKDDNNKMTNDDCDGIRGNIKIW